jgi:hypothetical protein
MKSICLSLLPWTRPFFGPWSWSIKWLLKSTLPQPDMVLLLLVLHILSIPWFPLLPHPHPEMHPGVPFIRPTHMHLQTVRALKNIHTNQTLFAEVTQPDSPDHPEVVSLDNPTEVDPSLILMTTNELDISNIPMFTHNCQIKHELATLILDNGSQKNLVAQNLVTHPEPPHHSAPDPIPAQLGTKGRPSSHCLPVLCGYLCDWPFLGYLWCVMSLLLIVSICYLAFPTNRPDTLSIMLNLINTTCNMRGTPMCLLLLLLNPPNLLLTTWSLIKSV